MLLLQNISYSHPNKDMLFSNLNLSMNNHDKVALIGNNGTGKSTLLKILTGELQPSAGKVHVGSTFYYVPQIFGQFNHLTIAQALKVENKLHALKEILNGNASGENFLLLQDDWTIEERCKEAFGHWQLSDLNLSQKMETLSGGQKTKVFLAGIAVHQPELILLDEPSNHLDTMAREILYGLLRTTKSSLLIVSHDKKLLNLLDTVAELTGQGLRIYGGNYDFYKAQKEIESNALEQDIQAKTKALRKAREKERDSIERQQRLDNRGKAKQEKAGVARIMMNTLRNSAENSTSKLKTAHAEKVETIAMDLKNLRSALPDPDKMRFGFTDSVLHKGKILFKADKINYCYDRTPLWQKDFDLLITSGERIALKGANGSGKTTLINLILGNNEPATGAVYRADTRAIYIDQDYSLLNNNLTVYEQAQQFNDTGLQEHEIKIRLNRFLFAKESWDKTCRSLSGGERMRLMLCCLTVSGWSPDMIVLDEPTNNLDIQNIEMLVAAVNEYKGTLLVVSHDSYFLEQVHVGRIIEL